ncbi:conserved membrane hypothetical protein [Vibrio nigripulchritudo SO65]|uniref:hypothetical protein n=1 Tax=Vibrio nigripulchritudo TaxID=28173 RepID=UPI0003B19CBE|nr:hypothetical protein [Vibrio nigripulchritudo]CCN35797.1 conserved membrane hypothetical protein [Vibrio nigripulchritudo AM115]CCN41862.1 conserved membrane hypothetical protein [Vibrio nigripulchritudo FTn2]CCN66345.1 conserved membrane hypothetical protein [Vibrio nigripulchritudo POn4]CCN74436.1 conserved membrane hypothetical protein [Vibrio nigripulchritudo SO65]
MNVSYFGNKDKLPLSAIVFLSYISIAFIFLLAYFYSERAFTLNLLDNDDFMRLHQFSNWLENGNWYLKPLEDFNQNDGQIIHWSRVPDIPLAAFTLLFCLVVSADVAISYAIIVVPLIYLIGTVFAIGLITQKFLGKKYVVLACLYAFGSHLITKFYPGSIDHHNIQLLLLAWFVALCPLSEKDAEQSKYAVIQGVLLAVSFWIGIENLPVFAAILVTLCGFGYWHSKTFLKYIRDLCCCATIASLICILLNRPFNEFLVLHVDMISWGYAFCLFVGGLFCQLSLSFDTQRHTLFKFLILGLISVATIFLFVPELVKGVYFDYPKLLVDTWLSNVSEARPILSYIKDDGFLSNFNYILFIFPALLSILLFNKEKGMVLLYLTMIFILLTAVLWQVRTIFSVFIFAVPLQAYLVIKFTEKYSSSLLRVSISLICVPIGISLFVSHINTDTENEAKALSNLEKVSYLVESDIREKKVLAPMGYGAPILAHTSNSVIAAPYHRNIAGNELMTRIFLSTDLDAAKQTILEHGFDYVVVGNDSSSNVLRNYSEEGAFIMELGRKNFDWLQEVTGNGNEVKVYQVVK